MGIVVRLPFVPPWYLPQRRPSRLRRSGRDITAALISTNYLLFNIEGAWGFLQSAAGKGGSWEDHNHRQHQNQRVFILVNI